MHGPDSSPPADAPSELIPVLRFLTDHLPPAERYRAWLLRDWPRRQNIFRTEPSEPFNTTWESALLGDIMFVYTEITGMRWNGGNRTSDHPISTR